MNCPNCDTEWLHVEAEVFSGRSYDPMELWVECPECGHSYSSQISELDDITHQVNGDLAYEELSEKELDALTWAYGGADVNHLDKALILRGIERRHRDLGVIHICEPMGTYDVDQPKPYFGATLTPTGKHAVDTYLASLDEPRVCRTCKFDDAAITKLGWGWNKLDLCQNCYMEEWSRNAVPLDVNMDSWLTETAEG